MSSFTVSIILREGRLERVSEGTRERGSEGVKSKGAREQGSERPGGRGRERVRERRAGRGKSEGVWEPRQDDDDGRQSESGLRHSPGIVWFGSIPDSKPGTADAPAPAATVDSD